jgi:hypothetical protein
MAAVWRFWWGVFFLVRMPGRVALGFNFNSALRPVQQSLCVAKILSYVRTESNMHRVACWAMESDAALSRVLEKRSFGRRFTDRNGRPKVWLCLATGQTWYDAY